MSLFDNGKFQGVQEEDEKNPERVNINLINMIISHSLSSSLFLKMTSSIKVCALLPEQGLCKAKIDRFYFDPKVFSFSLSIVQKT